MCVRSRDGVQDSFVIKLFSGRTYSSGQTLATPLPLALDPSPPPGVRQARPSGVVRGPGAGIERRVRAGAGGPQRRPSMPRPVLPTPRAAEADQDHHRPQQDARPQVEGRQGARRWQDQVRKKGRN